MIEKQWIMIQNPGELEIWGIRLLGLSVKSGDSIGKFGTGLKETIALVFRLKSELIIYAGTTCYTFSIQENDGQNEIGFTVNDQKWQGMGLHPDFGRHDWNSPWQVLREVFCNAVDEGVDDLYYDMVSEAEGIAGSTRVFIRITNQLKNAFFTIDRKLLMLGSIEPISSNQFGSVYEKIGIGDELQCYHRKVWIDRFGRLSLFDYEINDLTITESRTCSSSEVRDALPLILLTAKRSIVKRILLLVKDEGTKQADLPYEILHTHAYDWSNAVKGYDPETGRYTEGVKHEWVAAWHDLFGHDAVAIKGETYQYDNIKDLGKTPIIIIGGWIGILESLGIPTHTKVLNTDQMEGREIVGPLQGLHITWKMLGELTAGMNQPQVMLYKEIGSNIKQGFVRQRCVFINENIIGSEQENIVMLEQFAKYISDAGERSSKYEGWLVGALYSSLSKD